jgi:N-acetylmuramoyl-L-alanine amidase
MTIRHIHSSRHFNHKPAQWVLALTLAVLVSSAEAREEPTTMPLQALTQAHRAELEALVNRELQRSVLGKFRQVEGAKNEIRIHATFDLQSDLLIVDMGSEYGPLSDDPVLQDIKNDLSEVARSILSDFIPYHGIDFRYGGRDFYYYHPEARQYQIEQPRPQSKTNDNKMTGGTAVVISPGHGYFKLYSGQNFGWTLQRSVVNGIQEDFIAADYANELKTWMVARSKVTIDFTRSTSQSTQLPSEKPWWQLAARYHLEEIYPNNPKIWNSKPEDTSSSREYRQDIRSRPLFANHIGAGAIVHLHTNASSNASANGTKVFFQKGKTLSQQFGNVVLCSMKELIHAQDAYKNFKVAPLSEVGDHGENSYAMMPSIIVEVGFHTNPADAAALQDPIFRTAAMKGVEKGYRLFSEEKECTPFSIVSARDNPDPSGAKTTVELEYKGYPQFGLQAQVEVLECPAIFCSGGSWVIDDPTPSPIRYDIGCNVGIPMQFRLRTTLTDTDGVKAATEHTVMCLSSFSNRNTVQTESLSPHSNLPRISD